VYFLKMKIDVGEIGIRIKKIRREKGLTQDFFGQMIGVKGPAISKYEKGDQEPGILALVKIAELGNVSLDYLITGSGPGQTLPPADPVELLIFSNPQTVEKIKDRLRSEVCEEITPYKQALPADQQQLLDAWQHASPEIKGAALTILKQSANESRQIDGGGSHSAAQDSA
jgi:transcriptional regulator with XRE-family HTH domain